VNPLLVLAEPYDSSATALAEEIAARLGDAAVLWLTPQQLGRTVRWKHTVSRTGRAHTELNTPDGISYASVGAVLNRVDVVTPVHFARADLKDRIYATTELTALLWSWLAGLRVPVLNPPGRRRSPRWWLTTARLTGLPLAAPLRPTMEVLVTGDRAHGELADRWGDACIRLAAAGGCRLLACRFARAGGVDALVAAEPTPRLDTPAAVKATGDYVSGLLTQTGPAT
jgi:hypothetical protein